MNYNVNYRTIITNLIPSFLRTTNFMSYLYSLIKGLQDINTNLYSYTTEVSHFLKFKSQVIYLQKYLNDVYDPISQRIYIYNGMKSINVLFNRAEYNSTQIYCYNRSETSAPKTYVTNRSEPSTSGYDYTVFVPTEFETQKDRITASINLFNPADKNFNIELL
jgi:hypothetical protein